MVDKIVDAEQLVGPLIFWSYYGPKHSWTVEHRAYVISIFAFFFFFF